MIKFLLILWVVGTPASELRIRHVDGTEKVLRFETEAECELTLKKDMEESFKGHENEVFLFCVDEKTFYKNTVNKKDTI